MPVRSSCHFTSRTPLHDSNNMLKISDLLAQITGEPSPTTSNFPQSPKPKPDEGVRRPLDKLKTHTTQSTYSLKPTADPRKTPGGDTKTKPPANGSSLSSTTTFKNGQPTPPPSNDAPKAPPKKGSYAEIMARGQAAQKVLGQVGKIQHKKIEKIPSRREREEMRAQRAAKVQKGLAPNSKFRKSGQPSLQEEKTGSNKRAKAREPAPDKKVKKAALATTGYAGTARPKLGNSSRSGSHAGSSSRRVDRYGREGSGQRGSRYDEYEDDEAEEEEELDYESDVSSDMEAAAFEVDEEEAMAERIARREDAEALAEENRLKREKAEKRRRLMAMAKKAKPMSY
jgi:protein SPT2